MKRFIARLSGWLNVKNVTKLKHLTGWKQPHHCRSEKERNRTTTNRAASFWILNLEDYAQPIGQSGMYSNAKRHGLCKSYCVVHVTFFLLYTVHAGWNLNCKLAFVANREYMILSYLSDRFSTVIFRIWHRPPFVLYPYKTYLLVSVLTEGRNDFLFKIIVLMKYVHTSLYVHE